MKEEIAELLPSGDEDRLPLCPEEKPWLVGFVYQFDCQEEMKWCCFFFVQVWDMNCDVASEHNWSFVSPRERSRPQERSLQEHKDLTGFYNVVGCWRSSHWDIFYSLCSHIQLCFSENHGWMEYVSQTVFFFPHPETADIGDGPWLISARCTRDILPVFYAEKLLHYRYDIDKESVYIWMSFQLQF